jgi:hypothetical protein
VSGLGAGELSGQMAVYQRPPEALGLPEGNRAVAGFCFFFFFHFSSFAFLKNGAGSWKSLEGFHSNYSEQLVGVF